MACSILAVQILEGGQTGLLWNVDRMWLSPFTDIAFLRLSPTCSRGLAHYWQVAKMVLTPPREGTRIGGFGYHSSHIEATEENGVVHVIWKDSPTTTIGEVIQVHHGRRDSFRLTYPCFQTNARFDGGMSGGPVFDEKGHLCGLVCSNLPPSSPEEFHVSYVCMLWPNMGTWIDMDREGFPHNISYPALELAQHRYIQAAGWEKIVFVGEADQPPTGVALRYDKQNGDPSPL
jgi:Trypsin-like peptidase domain